MAEMNHTPEPWILHDENATVLTEHRQYNRTVCHTSGNDTVQTYANARRIVQCVNALAGIEDPEAYITALQAENKRLREALERFTLLNESEHPYMKGWIQEAKKALKGGTK